jgi:hypothetical protein
MPSERLALLQGTLDLLILRAACPRPASMAKEPPGAIEQTSGDELLVEHGAL